MLQRSGFRQTVWRWNLSNRHPQQGLHKSQRLRQSSCRGIWTKPANAQRWGNVVTTLSLIRLTTTLLQCCHNVMKVISLHCGNVASTLVSCCSNTATALGNYVILRRCHKIVATLKMTFYINIYTTIRQGCVNTVWMLMPTLKSDQTTTFRQRFHNVVAMLKITEFSMLPKRCHNVAWTLCERRGPTKVPMFTQHCTNVGK